MSAIARNNFLSSVIAGCRGERLAHNEYRRYRSVATTSAVVGGVNDTRAVPIFYEVGTRFGNSRDALSRPPAVVARIEASYPTNTVLAEDFIGLAKKYSNFSSTFEHSSLAGVAERLARALAATSIWSDFDSTALAARNNITIHALGVYDGPVNSLTTTVFIPRLTNTNVSGDVFAALIAAVAGEGGSVATDVLEIDSVTRQAIVPVVAPAALPMALVSALRIVGANMIASDQGPLFSLAVTRGVHKVMSVVGHTDEGGILRDMLRCSSFAPPFGGVSARLQDYAGLPALSTNNLGTICSYVDGVALTTAAVAAHCDPGNIYNDEWFPTFYLGDQGDMTNPQPGTNVAGTPAMSAANRSHLLSDQGRFWELYTVGLSLIFCSEGSNFVACRFAEAASYSLPPDPRHLRYPSVCPYFWIEPTSLIPTHFVGTDAENLGHASFAGPDETNTIPAWEAAQHAGGRDTTFSAIHVHAPSARRIGLLAHFLRHPQAGLGCISIRQLDPTTILHPGPCAGFDLVRDRVEATRPITDFLWTRGQSPFPAPGEFLNLGKTAGLYVRHYTYSDDGDIIVSKIPAARELLDSLIKIEVSHPLSLPNGQSNQIDPRTARARTRAARELTASKHRAAAFGTADIAEMPVMTSAPKMAAPPRPTPPPQSGGGDDGRGPPPVHSDSQSGGTAAARNPVGAAHLPVGHEGTYTAPQAPRPGGPVAQRGGGAPPPPPQGPARGPPPPGGPNNNGGGGNGGDLAPPAAVQPGALGPNIQMPAAPGERADQE